MTDHDTIKEQAGGQLLEGEAMTEKLQAVIGRMQHQIVALTAERDGARGERNDARLAAHENGVMCDNARKQRDTARAELAAVRGVVEEIRRLCMDVNRPGVPETNVTIYKMADRFLGIIDAAPAPQCGELNPYDGGDCITCAHHHDTEWVPCRTCTSEGLDNHWEPAQPPKPATGGEVCGDGDGCRNCASEHIVESDNICEPCWSCEDGSGWSPAKPGEGGA